MKKKGESTHKAKKLQKGDHVRIVSQGKFWNQRGIIRSVNGHSRAVVQIEGYKNPPMFFLNQLQRT